MPPPGPDFFEVGQGYFAKGDFAKAAQAYEIYLRDNFSPANGDEALLRLALTHALPESSVRDMPKALALLQRIVKSFPQSPFAAQAEFILGLQREVERLRFDVGRRDDRIRQLSEELEQLKQIDMNRRPTRPPQ